MLDKKFMEDITIARKAYFSSGVNSTESKWGEGHNYVIEAFVRGPIDTDTGLVMNLTDLDRFLKVITDEFDHKHLNKDFDYFGETPVTPEQLAEYCHLKLKKLLENEISHVTLIRTLVRQSDSDFGFVQET